ncbi:MAG: acyl-CoA thioesterase [Deltaproteobacteria bacterium]|jgi:acyl-CoA thioester hydrolase|nr:acyl-CoA thioesterase [Deltaproteobacteria bacterium]
MAEPTSPVNSFVATSWYRVLYVDTDLMGVVNNGHYFRVFEMARGEYLRQLGFPYSRVEENGVRTPLTEASAHFYLPFHYDDLIRVECWIALVKKASFRFDYRLFLENEREPRVAGKTLHATLNLENKVVKIPSWLRDVISSRPAGLE